jgi:hypothetical protein
MKQKILWFPFLVMMTIFVVGCGTVNNSNDLKDFPDIGTPVINPNQYLKINTPKAVSSLRKDNRIFLLIENLSQSIILIEPSKDVKIFRKLTSGWHSVQNNIDYNNAMWPVAVKGGDIPNVIPIDVYPGLNEISAPIILRVVVIGKPENLPDVTNTISYVDITVNP